MWERMQVEAEEKKKGYCCLVYCEKFITPENLLLLEQASVKDVDEEGVPCLQVLLIVTLMSISFTIRLLTVCVFVAYPEDTITSDASKIFTVSSEEYLFNQNDFS
jgi:hypothetical protein